MPHSCRAAQWKYYSINALQLQSSSSGRKLLTRDMKSHRQAHMKNASLLIKMAVILICACCCHSGIGMQPQAPTPNLRREEAMLSPCSLKLWAQENYGDRFIERDQVTEYLTLGFPLKLMMLLGIPRLLRAVTLNYGHSCFDSAPQEPL